MTAATTDIQPHQATVQYVPTAPIGDARNLKRLFETQKNSIMSVLPKHVTPDRLLKTFLVAMNRVPNLLNCTQSSVLETINRAGELGLDLSGTLGEAYPVPYGNQCQLIIGYRGLAKLARQSGEVATISSDVVCKNDRFTFRKGGNAVCEWEPPLQGDRGEVIGAFAHVQFKDGTQQFDYMTASEIEKVRARSRSGKSGPWQTDWNEMAKKTVFRRLAKWLPLSTEKFVAALEHEDQISAIDLPDESVAKRGSAALMERLEAQDPATAPQNPQEPSGDQGGAEGGGEPPADPDAIAGAWQAVKDGYFAALTAKKGKPTDASYEQWRKIQVKGAADEQQEIEQCMAALDDMK